MATVEGILGEKFVREVRKAVLLQFLPAVHVYAPQIIEGVVVHGLGGRHLQAENHVAVVEAHRA